jgi:hypothetical protein
MMKAFQPHCSTANRTSGLPAAATSIPVPLHPPVSPCPTPFWGCLDCRNAVITARKLPAILAFLSFVDDQRSRPEGQAEWAAKFGHAHDRIVQQILPAFGDDVVARARAQSQRSSRGLPAA